MKGKRQRERERVGRSNIQKGKERRRGKRGEIESKERVSGRGEIKAKRQREETYELDREKETQGKRQRGEIERRGRVER